MAEFVSGFVWIPTELHPKVSGDSLAIHKHREHGGSYHVVHVSNLMQKPLGRDRKLAIPIYEPIHPGMSLQLRRIRLHVNAETLDRSEVSIPWEVYADHAPVEKGRASLFSWVRMN